MRRAESHGFLTNRIGTPRRLSVRQLSEELRHQMFSQFDTLNPSANEREHGIRLHRAQVRQSHIRLAKLSLNVSFERVTGKVMPVNGQREERTILKSSQKPSHQKGIRNSAYTQISDFS